MEPGQINTWPLREGGSRLDLGSILGNASDLFNNLTQPADSGTGIVDYARAPSDLRQFGITVGINIAVMLILFGCFIILRRKVPWYYNGHQDYMIDKQTTIPDLPAASWFAWIKNLFMITEMEILEYAGLDVYMFLRMFRMGIVYFIFVGIYGLAVLLPVYITSSREFDQFDQLSMTNVPQGSSRLWAPFVGVVLNTALLMFLLDQLYKDYQQIRTHWMQDKHAHAYTVLVKQIPEADRNSDDLARTFNFIFPNDVRMAFVNYNTKKLDGLLKKRKSVLKKLEKAYVAVAKDNKLPRAEPTIRLGFCGLFGEKVPSISQYSKELEELNQQVVEEQAAVMEPYHTGFVTFKSLVTASSAMQCQIGDRKNIYITRAAPEPRDIHWGNINTTLTQKAIWRSISMFLTVLLIFTWFVPVAFVQSLVSANNLQKAFPWLTPLFEEYPNFMALVMGYIPALVLSLFLLLIPVMTRALSKMEGLEARSWIEFAAADKVFYFNVFNVFLGSIFSGTIFQIFNVWKTLVSSPGTAFKLLGAAIPTTATFFINFVVLQTFSGMTMTLLDIFMLIGRVISSARCSGTPRAVKAARHPLAPDYLSYVSASLLIFLLGMTYSTIAPLILPFILVYFTYGYYVYKYHLLFVRAPRYESGGLFFPLVFARLCVCLGLCQATHVGLLAAKGFYLSPLLILLIIATYIFYRVERDRYDVDSVPLLTAQDMDEDSTKEDGLVRFESFSPLAYVKPCLLEGPATPDIDDLAFSDEDTKSISNNERIAGEDDEAKSTASANGNNDKNNIAVHVGDSEATIPRIPAYSSNALQSSSIQLGPGSPK